MCIRAQGRTMISISIIMVVRDCRSSDIGPNESVSQVNFMRESDINLELLNDDEEDIYSNAPVNADSAIHFQKMFPSYRRGMKVTKAQLLIANTYNVEEVRALFKVEFFSYFC